MPTLLAPPPAALARRFPRSLARPAPMAPALNPPAGLREPCHALFTGRTLAEYQQCFALDLAALKRRDVLDVAAGPSSFTAEACARGIDAVAVDPLYLETPDELAARADADHALLGTQLRARSRQLRPSLLPSLAAAATERQLAAQRFLADFVAHRFYGRYVGAALPHLPFFDGTFDLVLCADLLFASAVRFDFNWHLAACRELVRVSASEVRLHPVVVADGRLYPGLPRLRRELKSAGIASELVRVDYESFVGSDAMLVLRRAGP